MARDQITTEEVTQAVLHRITTGLYVPGERLPSVRALAKEIGANRNTINKAYQILLDLGVIENSASGRRGFSARSAPAFGTQTKSELLEYFYQQSIDLVWKGMAAGITSNEMLDQLKAAVGEVFGHGRVRLIFYECNEYDTVEMGRSLTHALDTQVEYKILPHFYKNIAGATQNYDLIITTYHHLAEIIHALRQENLPPGQVIGIETRPSTGTMLRIARLPAGKAGIVCTVQNTAHMLKHILYGYHPEWEIEAVSLDVQTPHEIKALAHNSDHLIVTHTCADEVTRLTGRELDVVVNFQIDEQSILFLKQRIYAIQMEKMQQLQTIYPESAHELTGIHK